jgi:tetratricopeptide (TPR) repeat protein
VPLPVALFLDGLNVLKRRSQVQPAVSVVVSLRGQSAEILESMLASARQQDLEAVEFLVVDDGLSGKYRTLVDKFSIEDDRVTVLRFPNCRGIQAIGVNAALGLAKSRYVAYQIGQGSYVKGGLRLLFESAEQNSGAPFVSGLCQLEETLPKAKENDSLPLLDGLIHRRELLDWIGFSDPHILMCDSWAEDLCERILKENLGIFLSENILQPYGETESQGFEDLRVEARARQRYDMLSPDCIGQMDVLDASFLSPDEVRDRFCDEVAAPYVAAHWQEGERLHPRAVTYMAIRQPLHLLVRGRSGTGSMEITYGNFMRTFPDLLHIRNVGFGENTRVKPEEDALVNFRCMRSLSSGLHETFRDAGKPVIYAMDDNLLRRSELPLFRGMPRTRNQEENLVAHLKDADTVLTWSKYCAEDVRPINPRVFVLRTNVEGRRLPEAPSPPAADGRLIYSTLSANLIHRAEWWQAVVNEWADFFRQHKDKARLVLFCSDKKGLLLYREWFKGIDYEARPYQPYQKFLDSLSKSGFHVVMAQIDEATTFSKSKCPLKFLDATACGAILTASFAEPFGDLKDGEECIKVPNRPGAWAHTLEKTLLMGQEGRLRMWKAARRRVKQDFTTESQYFAFFLAHEAARLYGVLSSRSCPSGKTSIFLTEPADAENCRTIQAWRRLLERLHLEVVAVPGEPRDVQDGAIKIKKVLENGNPFGLIVAPTPHSFWVAAAREVGLPVIAVADILDVPPIHALPPLGKQPDFFFARSATVAHRLRKAGCVNVVRLGVPLTPCGWTSRNLRAYGSDSPRVRIGVVRGPDVDVGSIVSRVQEAIDFGAAKADIVVDPGPCDILIVSGHGGNVMNVGLAAMAAGILVVALDSDDFHEIITSGVNGWSLRNATKGFLAEVLREALTLRPEEQASVRRNTRATAWARTNQEAILLNLTSILRRVVSRKLCQSRTITRGECQSIGGDHANPLDAGNRTKIPGISENPAKPCKDPSEALKRAQTLMKRSQFEAAAEAYRILLDYAPCVQGFLGLVRALIRQKRPEFALKEAAHALELFPKSAPLLAITGRLRLQMGQPEGEAERFFEQALAINNRHIDALVGLARAAMGRSDWNVALDRWKRCLEAFPEHRNLVIWLTAKADVLMELERYDEAEEVYGQVLEKNPEQIGACEGLAKLAEQQGSWALAIDRYQHWLGEFPDHPKMPKWRASLGNLLIHTGDLDAAEAEFRRLVDQFPDRPVGSHGLHWVSLLRKARLGAYVA